MKKFDMNVSGKTISFTTKSVTIDGVEYMYGKMSGIKHSAERHIYAFKYNNEYKYLPYDPKYGQILGAIFKQVNALDRKRQEAIKLASTQDLTSIVREAQAIAEATAAVQAEKPATEAPKADEAPSAFTVAAPAEPVKEEPVVEAPKAAPETPAVEEPKTEPETPAVVPAEEPKAEAPAPADKKAAEKDPEKKARLKKSLVVFIAIIAVIGILTAGYFALFGTSNNPTAGPNSTESQQYDNIDELIEDLD